MLISNYEYSIKNVIHDIKMKKTILIAIITLLVCCGSITQGVFDYFPILPSKSIDFLNIIDVLPQDKDSLGKYQVSDSFCFLTGSSILLDRNLNIALKTPSGVDTYHHYYYYYNGSIIDHYSMTFPSCTKTHEQITIVKTKEHTFFSDGAGSIGVFPEYNLVSAYSKDDKVKFVDLNSGEKISQYKTRNKENGRLSINPISKDLVQIYDSNLDRATINDLKTGEEICEIKGKYGRIGEKIYATIGMIFDLETRKFVYFDTSNIPEPVKGNIEIKNNYVEYYTHNGPGRIDDSLGLYSNIQNSDNLYITRVSFQGDIIEKIHIEDLGSPYVHILNTQGDCAYLYLDYEQPEKRELVIYNFRKKQVMIRLPFRKLTNFKIIPLKGEKPESIIICPNGAMLVDLQAGSIEKEVPLKTWPQDSNSPMFWEPGGKYYFTKPESVLGNRYGLFEIGDDLSINSLDTTLPSNTNLSFVESNIVTCIDLKGSRKSGFDPWDMQLTASRCRIGDHSPGNVVENFIKRINIPTRKDYGRGILILSNEKGNIYSFNTKTGSIETITQDNQKPTCYKVFGDKLFVCHSSCKKENCSSKVLIFNTMSRTLERSFEIDDYVADIFAYEYGTAILMAYKGAIILDEDGHTQQLTSFPFYIEGCDLYCSSKKTTIKSVDLGNMKEKVIISNKPNTNKPLLFVNDNLLTEEDVINSNGEIVENLNISSFIKLNDVYIDENKQMYGISSDGVGALTSFSPCPTFSVSRSSNSNDKATFSFTNTRQDDLDLVLKGEAYLASWGDDGKPPIFTKLDEPHHKLGPLVPGMSQEITFDLPKPLEFDGKKSEGKYFALIVESNGLLDTKNSELSDFDREGRPLFDGTPLSLDKQHAIVLTVWKR